jgi:colanic acid biosynthesis glycosyl transferase WcaI
LLGVLSDTVVRAGQQITSRAAHRLPQIIFLNRYFCPDRSSTSQILSDLAFYLAVRGEPVQVIASRRRYDDVAAILPGCENLRGVAIHRVATTRFGRFSLIGRAVDYASFYLSAGAALLRLARRGDVVVAKTDPPMLSVLTAALAALRGFERVNWLQDLYPEIAGALGVPGLGGAAGRILAGLRDRSLRGAAMNVAIGEDMAQKLHDMGLPAAKLRIIPNWSDDESIAPSESAANPLRREWSLEGKFVVLYSGNLGRAHDIDTMLGAAERLRARTDIVFLYIGSGFEFAKLQAEVRRRGLDNFRFKPYQPREALPLSLGVGDMHWLSLKPGLDGLILPSKFYGIAAAGRPILVIGSTEGELSRLVRRYACGYAVAPGRSDELADIVAKLADDPPRCRDLGRKARAMLDAEFTKASALEHWHEVLRQAARVATLA